MRPMTMAIVMILAAGLLTGCAQDDDSSAAKKPNAVETRDVNATGYGEVKLSPVTNPARRTLGAKKKDRPWWDWMGVTEPSSPPRRKSGRPWWDWLGTTDSDSGDKGSYRRVKGSGTHGVPDGGSFFDANP
ncbi:MAG: hypothetical protein ACLFV7_14970 [Phycisphaerae bacterium]